MFYEGDLQSGIAKALQESKLVACFVTDDGVESRQWENEFLEETTLKTSLSEQAIVLRLEAGSTEAGYLAAIYPLPKTPTFVVIKNGELKQYIASGVSKEDFLSRLKAVFVSNTPQASGTTSDQSPAVPSSHSAQPPTQDSTATSTPSQSTPSINPSSAAVQDLLSERSRRLEAHKKEHDAKEKAKRAAEAAERKKKLEEANAPGATPSADMKYALMQKQRQREAREERARILQRVEDDKAARRARAQQKAQSQFGVESPVAESGPSSVRPPSKKSSAECALQIRLFNGSTIRSRFPSQATLLKDVRPWIDESQPGDQPYTFKQVLTPLPNKNIETSEEERSLTSLDLTPSATLILLPVTGYSSAYAGGTGIVSTGVGMVSSGIGMASRLLGGIFGGVAAPTGPGEPDVAVGVAPSANVNVRTLRDREPREDQQFYNGNALNFEPRRDEGDRKDD